jgi:3-hydroxybutyryl-CoA dehydrogenase
MEIRKIAVIGAGTMGNGICHVLAQYGFEVALIDISQSALNKALHTIEKNLDRQISKEIIDASIKSKALANISIHTNTASGVDKVDLVIEAVTEQLDVKREMFTKLDQLCENETIIASNTSSISITKLASATQRPERVVGMHFMNPVPVMKLVEIIRGYATDEDVIQQITQLTEKLDKVPVIVNDYPGFIANRILMPMINEAIIALHEGVGGVKEIDTIMKLGMSHPMGPLQLADFIGLDVCASILKVLYEGFGNPKYAPSPLLLNMVAAGHLGVKSGEGFYNWQHGTKDLMISSRFQ